MAVNVKTFVIDASAVLSFLLSEETPNIDQRFNEFLNSEIQLVSSALLPYEVLNSLKMSVIRKRISSPQALELAETFLDYHILTKQVNYKDCLKLALSENLTFYDASYLRVSKDLHHPLITLDPHLQKYA
ncbi:hypothetical protein A2721_01665 [Candidatus Gottesmanbacteria bacterium RIFCSPHIGHO2_01_FULL_47_48]|uniref:PIN domain-containing protein n=1 Tax=Candidatus Gottesmanbacteria bacterium RIFCSPHIGHO2_01_FULL_47_48 TaxID=1798381 RepID=A0A1F6A1D3_9BACT|nr:MAG: hypothetical protein A2721_01665 [Candidatus Gottesmanbacteria bacterium RIFCSPHIGHO2_01_FULL_47_48]